MELREMILAEHSKANTLRIAKWIGRDQERFDQLFTLVLNDKDPVIIQRAAWPLSNLVLHHPALIQKHFGKLITNLKKTGHHDSVKRNTLRILTETDLPEKYHGEVMNLCFNYILSPSENPAIKAFSIAVLQKLSKLYPNIISEIKTIIEDRWDIESSAFKTRAKRFIKATGA